MSATTSVCLALIVRDEASIIKRCIDSALPFIDSWVIHDLGSSDATRDIIEESLSDLLPGSLQRYSFAGFAQARNRLLQEAANYADLVLMLDADEELQCRGGVLELPPAIHTGYLTILQRGHNIRQPRVFRATHLPHYVGYLGEYVATKQDTIHVLDGIQLRHHQDGVRHRNPNVSADARLLGALCNEDDASAQSFLALGQAQLRAQSPESAQNALAKACAAGPELDTHWLALYLQGLIQIEQGDLSAAQTHFQAAFDLDPDRSEPLVRLAEMASTTGNFEMAVELCEVALEVPPPQQALYVEPDLYRYKVRLLAAEAALSAGQHESAARHVKKLQATHGLSASDAERLAELVRQIANGDEAQAKKQSGKAMAGTGPNAQPHRPKLTIGMATYDDYHGVYFSIMSILIHHKDALDDIELLVVDNNPQSAHGKAVEQLCNKVANTRYVAASEYTGTAVRERVFIEARGDFVLCMDCHVLLHPGSVQRLIQFIDENPQSNDLLHGPLVYDNTEIYSTHMEPRWNHGFYGVWATDERGLNADAEPFEIPLQGLGLFGCRRQSWPGFNLRFRGFGGEEGYIHEKFRQRGGRVLCLPFLRWTHRFERPDGTVYANRLEDRVRNYLLGWRELGMPDRSILDHFSEWANEDQVLRTNTAVLWEQRSVFWGLDTIFAIAESDQLWEASQALLTRLGIAHICRRVSSAQIAAQKLLSRDAQGLPNICVINLNNLANHHLSAVRAWIASNNPLSPALSTLTADQEVSSDANKAVQAPARLDKQWQVLLTLPSSYPVAAAQLKAYSNQVARAAHSATTATATAAADHPISDTAIST